MPSKKGSSKKAKKAGSSIFDMFTERQVAEFKEGFQFMDRDKDGVIGSGDIRATSDEVGRMTSDAEVDSMIQDGGGNLTFTSLVHMFGSRSGGETDEDATIVKAFRTFEAKPGIIEADSFKSLMMAFGQRFTQKEMDDAFEHMELDEDGNIMSDAVIKMLTGSSKKEESQPA